MRPLTDFAVTPRGTCVPARIVRLVTLIRDEDFDAPLRPATILAPPYAGRAVA